MWNALQVTEPRPSVLVLMPSPYPWPIVHRYSLSDFRAGLRGQRGINRAINAGVMRSGVSLRYDRAAQEMITCERDCLNRLHLVVHPAIPLGLVLTEGTGNLWRDMSRLFDSSDDADAAAADVLRMVRQIEAVQAIG